MQSFLHIDHWRLLLPQEYQGFSRRDHHEIIGNIINFITVSCPFAPHGVSLLESPVTTWRIHPVELAPSPNPQHMRREAPKRNAWVVDNGTSNCDAVMPEVNESSCKEHSLRTDLAQKLSQKLKTHSIQGAHVLQNFVLLICCMSSISDSCCIFPHWKHPWRVDLSTTTA